MNSKKKGNRGELEVAHFLHAHGWEARRGQQFSGSPDSPDVISSLPVHIEVKRTENLSIYKAMAQAKNDCGAKIPTVWHRRNREDWLVILTAEDFLSLIGRNKNETKTIEDSSDNSVIPDSDSSRGL